MKKTEKDLKIQEEKIKAFDEFIKLLEVDNGKNALNYNCVLRMAKKNHKEYNGTYALIQSMSDYQEFTQKIYDISRNYYDKYYDIKNISKEDDINIACKK